MLLFTRNNDYSGKNGDNGDNGNDHIRRLGTLLSPASLVRLTLFVKECPQGSLCPTHS